MKCKVCDVEKARIKVKKRQRPNGRFQGWIYKDETGKLWQGAVCRTCFTKKGASHPQDDPVYKPIYRKCKECGANTVNYFKCQSCWEGKLGYTIDIESAYGYHNAGGYYGG